MGDMTKQPEVRARRSTPIIRQPAVAPRSLTTPGDRFFRQIVDSMRNGVLAIHRNGRVALMNDEAYRICGLERRPDDMGRLLVDVLRNQHDIIRGLSGSFELSHLPNRAELRLKQMDRVIGYTITKVRDDHAEAIGAVMFFKDLTQV